MKKFTGVFAVAILVAGSAASSVAHADLTGKWQGSGVITNQHGAQRDCASIIFDVSQTATLFTIKQDDIKCVGSMMTQSPTEFSIQDGKLFWSNTPAGTIDETTAVLESAHPQESYRESLHLNADGTATFEYRVDQASGQFFVIQGTLRR